MSLKEWTMNKACKGGGKVTLICYYTAPMLLCMIIIYIRRERVKSQYSTQPVSQ